MRTIAAAFWRSSVGKEVVMAVTGAILVGFVILHMLGNLKIYQGEEKFNTYATYLREVGLPVLSHEQFLWTARLVLLVAVVLHIVAAVQLTLMSRAARPIRYRRWESVQATCADLTMGWTGTIIALFVIFHILHFTVGAVGFAPGQYRPMFVYRNVVNGFRVWYVSAFYIAAMVALGLHLDHGVWSIFHHLGRDARSNRCYRALALAVATAVVVGNISIPVAVLIGWVH